MERNERAWAPLVIITGQTKNEEKVICTECAENQPDDVFDGEAYLGATPQTVECRHCGAKFQVESEIRYSTRRIK